MKRFIPLLLLLATLHSSAQKNSGNKAPSQAEIDRMMKEAQKMLDEVDPATKRALDSMGVKMPTSISMPKMDSKQLNAAWEAQQAIVPKRNPAKINSIPGAINAGSVGAYINASFTKQSAKLKPAAKRIGDQLYNSFKQKGRSTAQIGVAAATLWIMGKVEIAFYIMGKTCMADPAQTDNTSNYAAMLSMLGDQPGAIPLLNHLNKTFPRNTTLLNNLGQAWFGMGELTKATLYFDSTLRLAPMHPQANFSKACIEQNRGNKKEAIALVKKSIKAAYSEDKEARLRDLGYSLTGNDLDLPGQQKQDPFQLGGFRQPAYPKSVAECVTLGAEWAAFDKEIEERSELMKKQQEEAKKTAEAVNAKRVQQLKAQSPSSMMSVSLTPLHFAAASKKLAITQEEFNRKLEAMNGKLQAFESRATQLTNNYNKLMEKLRKEDIDQTGEGKPNRNFCPQYQKASDDYLNAYNTELEQLSMEMNQVYKVYLNESGTYMLYMTFPEEFEVVKYGLKLSWLSVLKNHPFKSITQYVCKPQNNNNSGSAKLAAFDDINCQYHSSFWTPMGTMKMDCSRWTTELDLEIVKIGLKQDMNQETFGDQFVSCTVEVGTSIGKEIEKGPLTFGAEAGAGVGIEIDRSGVKDVFVTAGVKGGVTVTGPVDASGGVEGRVSLISGATSVSGTGVFEK
ncbi:hypothetical protein JMG10_05430 [Nostoc ellipsosporum NOK]|nr:hypothetical protein [Nostoc ellipsosporum NOK]